MSESETHSDRVYADFAIKNIGQLLTLKGPMRPRRGPSARDLGIIKDAFLAGLEGKVVAVGPMSDFYKVLSRPGCQVIDASGRLVTPGFVDAHTHLVFGGWRYEEYSMRCAGISYLEIGEKGGGILSTVKATREATFEGLLRRTLAFLDQALSFGTTTIEAKSGYGLDFDTEIKQLKVLKKCAEVHPCTIVPTFLGAHAVPQEFKDNRQAYLNILREVERKVKEEKLADFVDVFCDKGAFSIEEARQILGVAKTLGFGLKIHADELEQTGGAQLACEMQAQSCDHLVKVSREGIERLSQSDTVAVLLPATSCFLGKWPPAPGRALLDAGVACALGTDFNPGTCTALSMPLVMTLACSTMGFSPEEAFTAATWNAAWAVGLGGEVGCLAPGFSLDALIFDAQDYREVPYRFGINLVKGVIKKGKVVWGDKTFPEVSP